MNKPLIPLVALHAAMALALVAAPVEASPLLSLQAQSSAAQRGTEVDFTLQASGLHDSTPSTLLADFDLSISYDAATLTPLATPFVAGTALGDPADPSQTFYSSDTAVPGVLRLLGLSLLESSVTDCVFCTGPFLADQQGNSFVLGTIRFLVSDTAQGGVTSLTLPASTAVLGDGTGSAIAVTTDASTSVSVPEPPGPALVVCLLAAAWRGHRSRRAGPASGDHLAR